MCDLIVLLYDNIRAALRLGRRVFGLLCSYTQHTYATRPHASLASALGRVDFTEMLEGFYRRQHLLLIIYPNREHSSTPNGQHVRRARTLARFPSPGTL